MLMVLNMLLFIRNFKKFIFSLLILNCLFFYFIFKKMSKFTLFKRFILVLSITDIKSLLFTLNLLIINIKNNFNRYKK